MADNISAATVEIPNRWSVNTATELYMYIKCKDLIINNVDYSGEFQLKYYLPYYPVDEPYILLSSVNLFQRELTDSAKTKLTAYLRQVLPPVDLPTLFAQLDNSLANSVELLTEQLERDIKKKEDRINTLKQSLESNWKDR